MKGERELQHVTHFVLASVTAALFALSLLEASLHHALLLSTVYRLVLLAQITLYFIGTLFALRGTLRRDLFIVIAVYAMFSIYIAKLFSKGVYTAIVDWSLTIIPSMRSSAAYMMLSSEGRINFQLDPHYLYPLEYLLTYIIGCVTDLPYHLSYILSSGLSVLVLNSVLVYVLTLRSTRLLTYRERNIDVFLLLASAALMFNLLSTFYLGEFGYSRSMFYLTIYVTYTRFVIGELKTLGQSSTLLLLAAGAVIGSLRVSLVLVILLATLIATCLIKRAKAGVPLMVYITVALLSITYMLYYGSLYVRGYTNYLEALALSLWNVLRHGIFEVERPPLHTIARAEHHSLYRAMSFLGGLSLFALLVLSYFTVLANFVSGLINRVKRRPNRMTTDDAVTISVAYEDAFSITSLLCGGVLGVAYLLNVLGLFVIDFESMTDLLLPLPLAAVLRVHDATSRGALRDNVVAARAAPKPAGRVLSALTMLVVVIFALSVFGLTLRHPILCAAEVVLTPRNAVTGLPYANEFFDFLTTYGDLDQSAVELRTTFSSLYLTLPLKYRGANLASVAFEEFNIALNDFTSMIFNNLAYSLFENNNKLITVDRVRVLPL